MAERSINDTQPIDAKVGLIFSTAGQALSATEENRSVHGFMALCQSHQRKVIFRR